MRDHPVPRCGLLRSSAGMAIGNGGLRSIQMRSVQRNAKPDLICPLCGHKGTHDRNVSLDNVFRSVANVMIFLLGACLAIIGLGGTFDLDPLWLERKCSCCGHIFIPGRVRRWDGRRCIICGYDLIGTPSNRCSECGWKIPTKDFRDEGGGTEGMG